MKYQLLIFAFYNCIQKRLIGKKEASMKINSGLRSYAMKKMSIII